MGLWAEGDERRMNCTASASEVDFALAEGLFKLKWSLFKVGLVLGLVSGLRALSARLPVEFLALGVGLGGMWRRRLGEAISEALLSNRSCSRRPSPSLKSMARSCFGVGT